MVMPIRAQKTRLRQTMILRIKNFFAEPALEAEDRQRIAKLGNKENHAAKQDPDR
jgi:hypothetical protein